MQIEMCKCCGKPKKPKNLSLVQQSITQTGAGALNIDGGRVGDAPRTTHTDGNHRTLNKSGVYGERLGLGMYETAGKRWPANFALCHTDQCVRVGERQVKGITGGKNPVRRNDNGWNQGYMSPGTSAGYSDYTDANGNEAVASWVCAAGCVVAALDAQAGERPSGSRSTGVRKGIGYGSSARGDGGPSIESNTGGASRFFMTADWSLDVAERLAEADPVFYSAKSAHTERDKGLLGYIACVAATDAKIVHEGDPLDTTRHYKLDSKGEPIRDKDGQVIWGRCRRNIHPTVKPLSLLVWLCRLLAPPAAYAPRRLLVPFAGSMSEACAAVISEQWENITAIEQDDSYCEIGRARLKYWQQQGRL